MRGEGSGLRTDHGENAGLGVLEIEVLVLERLPVDRLAPCDGVQGSGCRVQGAGCRVQGSGCRVQGSGFRVQGAGCRVQGSRLRVEG